jgi:K+-transporting ATPase ATPase A chain
MIMNFLFPVGDWVQFAVYFGVLLLLARPVGLYIAKVYRGENVMLGVIVRPIERGFYCLSGIQPEQDMHWSEYARALIWFSLVSFLLLFAVLVLQALLPLNPQHLPNLSSDLAFNTAVSFITNTNWQSYSGEATLSHFSQMAGLAVQNFLSPAVGLAVLMAFVRGLLRKNTAGIGNFWQDMVRANLYILLPFALIWALLLGTQGVVQTHASPLHVPLLEAQVGATQTITEQVLPVGPVASQVAIKQLGTNGGGYFNTNSAHPFENPTPLSNFLEALAILLFPAALCFTFGRLVGDARQGRALLAAMLLVLIPAVIICHAAEMAGNPQLEALGVAHSGNMEGKEARLGVANATLWAAVTTAASNGSVNAMHDSFTPLGGMVPMVLMQFGEVIFGGVGSGLYGMLVFVMITVFIAGLMVGRTPEYLGKKVQAFEIKMACIVVLVPCMTVLLGTALALSIDAGTAAILNPGAQGFSEVLYAFTSATNNNGSAFAGLSANTPFYNTVLGVCMLLGRFLIILPILALAGSFAAKNTVPESAGTLPTHTMLFVGLLVGTIVLVGVLTFVPALALGPVAEHLNLIH